MSRPPQRQRPSQERLETYPLPEDTRDILEKVTGEPQNYGLRIDRLLLCNKETWEPTKRSKERFIPSKNGKKVLTFTDDVASILRACKARLEAILGAYRNAGWEVRPVTLRAASRVVVGLGAESVLETSIRLHRVYGFPILPGSALKGLTRAYALWEIATKLGIPPLSYKELAEREQSKKQTPLQKLEKCIEEVETEKPKRQQLLEELQTDPALPTEARIRQLDIEAFDREVDPLRCIFGVAGQAGKVIFFDAIPANPANLKLELDVMNPHYAPYYQGTQPPADYHNPVLVFFLTIGAGSEFLFAVASRQRDLATQVQEWLKKALVEMGIGAKTVAGYGIWEECQETPATTSSTLEPTATVSPGPGREESSTKPARPEVLKELPRKADTQIPAEVVDNTSKPLKVRLLVEGYLDKLVPCSGIQNLASFPPGTFIWVTISQKDRDGTIVMVRLTGLWKAS
jgi:CRISPR type III-B/RAMP module RAMP protein Cmr6